MTPDGQEAPDAPPRRRKKRAPQRRQQILDAAVRLFYERGYAATGMQDIGEAAGITGPAIYRHFESKQDILTAAITHGTDQILAKVHEIVDTSTTPEETLERLARNFVRATLNNPPLAAIVTGEVRVIDKPSRRAVARAFSQHLEEWVQALRELRPDLPDAHLRVLVTGAFCLFESISKYDSGLESHVLEDLLVSMAIAGLLNSEASTPARARPASAWNVIDLDRSTTPDAASE